MTLTKDRSSVKPFVVATCSVAPRRRSRKSRIAEVLAAGVVLLGAVACAVRLADRQLPASSAGASYYVVKPGDTLLGIAEKFDGGGDPYPLVYRLEHQTRSAVIYPGERLLVPG